MVSRNSLKFVPLFLVLIILSTAMVNAGCKASNLPASSTRASDVQPSATVASVQTSVTPSTSQSNPAAPASASTSTSNVSFARDIQPIFSRCTGCHSNANASGGLSLEAGSAFKNLVNVKSTESALNRVTPGAPDKSYLINKLIGTQGQVGGKGAQMPLSGPHLQQDQITLIQQWILQGALDN